MTDEFGMVEPQEGEAFGDEWEEIDVSDDEADRIARRKDRDFDEFRMRLKDADQFKVEQSVFDDATFAAIYKLVQDGHIDAFGGPISTGKEANVFEALGGDDADVAVKIYRINASDFRHMRDYLEGDPRFENIGHDKGQVVRAWVRKEFANLERVVDDRARRLSEVRVENPQTAYEVVREYMRRLHRAGLVHGDLSEYNLIIHDGELVVIDLGQAVTVHHPNAEEFLRRDCRNVANFFRRQGADADGDSLYEFVTGDEGEDGDGDE